MIKTDGGVMLSDFGMLVDSEYFSAKLVAMIHFQIETAVICTYKTNSY